MGPEFNFDTGILKVESNLNCDKNTDLEIPDMKLVLSKFGINFDSHEDCDKHGNFVECEDGCNQFETSASLDTNLSHEGLDFNLFEPSIGTRIASMLREARTTKITHWDPGIY